MSGGETACNWKSLKLEVMKNQREFASTLLFTGDVASSISGTGQLVLAAASAGTKIQILLFFFLLLTANHMLDSLPVAGFQH